MRAIYLHRDWAAALPALGVTLVLVFAGVKEARPLKPQYDEPVKLEIIETASLPPTPPQEPPKPRPEPPKPQPKPERRPEPKPQQEPRREPRPEPRPAPEPAPAPAPAPTPAPAPMPAPTPAPTPAPSPAPAAAAPAPAPAPSASIEAEYVGKLRAYLNSIKRYPTGREASLQRPRGTVKLWFVLRRDGGLVDVGIEESSNSMLLDEAARKTISRAEPQPFPDAFKPGQATHRFTVELAFAPAG